MKTTIRSIFRLRSLSLALALPPLLAAASLHAQTLQNGSFENPALTNGSFAGGGGANWTTTGGAYVFTNGVGAGATTDGNQFEVLNPNATAAQTLTGAVIVGRLYTLSLKAADLNANSTDQLTLSVSGAATASQSFILPTNFSAGSAGPLPFATYSLSFTPTVAGSVTVSFANTTSGGFNIGLDNAQLSGVGGVPEPSTWAFVAAGTGLLGLTLRQRRAAAARA